MISQLILAQFSLEQTPLDLGGASRLAEPVWLHALWLAPLVLLLAWLAARARRTAFARLGDTALVSRLAEGAGAARRWTRAWTVAIALALLALGLARPQHGERTEEVEQRGRDLVFVIDVSRSMLARDLAPNRLARAKLWVNDLVDEMGGDRVALVAFAGAASIKCPLTNDRAFFRLALERLNPDSAPRGGTMIGDAVRKCLDDVFEIDPETVDEFRSARHQDIILITDGETRSLSPCAPPSSRASSACASSRSGWATASAARPCRCPSTRAGSCSSRARRC